MDETTLELAFNNLKDILIKYGIEFSSGAYYNYNEDIIGYWVEIQKQTIDFN